MSIVQPSGLTQGQSKQIVNTYIDRFEQEGESHSKTTAVWVGLATAALYSFVSMRLFRTAPSSVIGAAAAFGSLFSGAATYAILSSANSNEVNAITQKQDMFRMNYNDNDLIAPKAIPVLLGHGKIDDGMVDRKFVFDLVEKMNSEQLAAVQKVMDLADFTKLLSPINKEPHRTLLNALNQVQ